MKSWYSVNAAADGASADVTIFDEVGMWGVNARDFLAEVRALKAPTVRVLINSPGGSVVDALAIYNGLRQSGKAIEVEVLGIAASAASFIAMAGDKVSMPSNTFMFLHNPVSGVYGNAGDMREMADVLDKFGASLKATYGRRWKKDAEALEQVLADETWLTAAECLECGLADEITDPVAVEARYDLDRKMPAAVRALLTPKAEAPPEPEPQPTVTEPQPEPQPEPGPEPTVAEQVRQAAEAAGFASLAEPLVLAAASADAARNLIANAREVRALLAATNEAARETAALLMRPVTDVRAAILAERVARDEAAAISTTPPSLAAAAAPQARAGAINVVAFWKQQQEKQK
jgi:ATP-dependent Clp protease protease subunit